MPKGSSKIKKMRNQLRKDNRILSSLPKMSLPRPIPLRRNPRTSLPRQPRVQTAPVSLGRQNITYQADFTSRPSRSDGRMRVKHREFIGDIAGATVFTTGVTPINPGIFSTFPWLANLAVMFEKYQFRSLSFEYETESSTSTVGKVILAIDYDANDSPPLSKQQLMSYHNASSSSVWQNNTTYADSLDIKGFGPERFIRTGTLSANQDIKTFDLGNLFVGLQGCANNSIIGELYVCYDVELITPQAQFGAFSRSAKIACSGATTGNIFTSAIKTGSLNVVTTGLPANTIVFNEQGQFLVEMVLIGTSLVLPTIDSSSTINSSVNTASCIGSSLTQTTQSWVVQITATGQSMIFDLASGTISGSFTRISSYSVNLQ